MSFESAGYQLLPVLPELVLAVGAMALLMVGAYRGVRTTGLITALALGLLVLVGLLELMLPAGKLTTFGGSFIVDDFARFLKIVALIGSIATLVLSTEFLSDPSGRIFEYSILVLLSTLGMMVLISAGDLIALYLGLELMSLALYVVAASNRDNAKSTEAGLKYFVLGALSSGMLLYGASLIYGFTGTTGFDDLTKLLAGGAPVATGILIGLIFVVVGLSFKVSAVPFHMWTPDVYEGAPTPVSAFFAVAPKLAALALFIRFMLAPFGPLIDEWRQVIVFLSIASMVLGAVAAIAQQNIKRLMAYSSISHVGYALIGLAAGTADGIRGVLVYLAIYLVMTVGTWTVILCMRQRGRMLEGISDLGGLSQSQPGLALALAIFMFALSGIPPTAGFFGKFYVFLAAINAQLTGLAVIGVVTSVVSAFYYLRVVKVMYFDEPVGSFDRPITAELKGVLFVTAVVTLFFFVFPGPIVGGAEAAASALFAR